MLLWGLSMRVLSFLLAVALLINSSFVFAIPQNIKKQIQSIEKFSLNTNEDLPHYVNLLSSYLENSYDQELKSDDDFDLREYRRAIQFLIKKSQKPDAKISEVERYRNIFVEKYKEEPTSFWDKAYNFITSPVGIVISTLVLAGTAWFLWDHLKSFLFVNSSSIENNDSENLQEIDEDNIFDHTGNEEGILEIASKEGRQIERPKVWTKSLIEEAIRVDDMMMMFRVKDENGVSAEEWAKKNNEREIVLYLGETRDIKTKDSLAKFKSIYQFVHRTFEKTEKLSLVKANENLKKCYDGLKKAKEIYYKYFASLLDKETALKQAKDRVDELQKIYDDVKKYYDQEFMKLTDLYYNKDGEKNLKKSHVILIAQKYNSDDHNVLSQMLMSYYSQSVDVILIDHVESMKKISQKKDTRTVLLPHQINVSGWDNMKLNSLCKTNTIILKYMEELKEDGCHLILKYIAESNELIVELDKSYEKLLKEAYKTEIIDRNKSLFKTVLSVISKKALSKIFIIAHHVHLTDPKLKKYFEDKKINYTILMPRDPRGKFKFDIKLENNSLSMAVVPGNIKELEKNKKVFIEWFEKNRNNEKKDLPIK